MSPERVAKSAGNACFCASLVFLGAGAAWSFLRLLICASAPPIPACTESYWAPMALGLFTAAAFAALLSALSLHEGRRQSARSFFHPRRPHEGFHHLPTRAHKLAARRGHVGAWTGFGMTAAFCSWFLLDGPSQLSVAIALGFAVGSIITARIWLNPDQV